VTFAGRVREATYRRAVAERGREHDAPANEAEAHAIQLRLLNAEWTRLLATSRYFAALRDERGLPAQFASLDEFVAKLPSMTRAVAREHRATITCTGRSPEWFRVTGGSTAQPMQLPAWHAETLATRPDPWLGRGWYGVSAASRLFLIWGHSHLMGSGLAGALRARLREARDRALGYTRFSAYDLRPEKMREAAERMIATRPEYVIGYSFALDLFARVNLDRRRELRALGLKVVVATSESFPSPESRPRLEDLFGCPVAMEYGAVETGLVAHTRPPDGGFDVFWRTYLLDAEPSEAGHRIYVTSLYPRCFPLVRYEIGDEIRLPAAAGPRPVGIRHFGAVIGRANDYVILANGRRVHSELFTHALRHIEGIQGYQVVSHSQGVTLRYVGPGELTPACRATITGNLAQISEELGRVSFERVERLDQTVAGKTRMIVHE
jgi:phenylacetate-CoA ligase